ncbi:MAG TPA: hypothetical protein VJW73_06480 [Gemmatimonadaceae bacterium]|nr:hypothetical protein [Gemmatimonadaceae bacterium]
MKRNIVRTAPLVLATVAACSTATSGGVAASTQANTRANNPQLLRWTGTFQPIQQQTGDLGPRSTNKVYGTVSLSRPPENASGVHVRMELSTPLAESRQLHWAIFDGRCGSPSLPLLAIEQFPEMNVSNNGRGQLDADLPLALSTSGAYHVDVYWTTGHDQGDVMTCANVRLDKSR